MQDTDIDYNGIEVAANSLRGYNNLQPQSNTDLRAVPVHPGIATDSGDKVAGSPVVTDVSVVSTPDNGSHYTYGEHILVELTYNENITIRGGGTETWINIKLGEGDNVSRRASFHDNRTRLEKIYAINSDKLLFRYTVQAGDDDPDGISVAANEDGDTLGGGSQVYEALTIGLSEAERWKAVNTHSGTDELSAHQVDTVPFVKGASVVSVPNHGDTYGMGETIKIQLEFDQPMEAVNQEVPVYFYMDIPAASVSDGGPVTSSQQQTTSTLKRAIYNRRSDDRKKLFFHYDIQSGDADADGIALNSGSGGTLETVALAVKVPEIETYWDGKYQADTTELEGHKVTSNPFVTGATVSSTPANGETYTLGENIDIKLTFNEVVTVTGALSLTFQLGEVSSDDGHLRLAQYQSGSNTKELVFRYTVVQGDVDDNGILLNIGDAGEQTATSAGSVQSTSVSRAWSLKYNVSGSDLPNHKVSAKAAPSAPTGLTARGYSDTRIDLSWTAPAYNGGTDITGYRIEVSADGGDTWNVLAANTNNLTTTYSHTGLTKGDTRKYRVSAINSIGTGLASSEVSGVADVLYVEFQRVLESGTPTSDTSLTNSFVVRVGLRYPPPSRHYASVDGFDQEDIEVIGGSINRFIRHRSNQGVVYAFINKDSGSHRVTVKVGENVVDYRNWAAQVYYGSLASIDSVEITSDAGSDNTYGIGDEVEFTVTFSEAVTITGDPDLTFNLGGVEKTAGFNSASGSTATFTYEVVEGDLSSDGISVSANALSLEGEDAIQSSDLLDANLGTSAVAAQSGHKIDGVLPTYSASSVPAGGEKVVVEFSEDISVPSLLSTLSNSLNLDVGLFYRAVMDVSVDGKLQPLTGATLSGNELTLTLEESIKRGQNVTVLYNNIFARDAEGIFIDGGGNLLANFGAQSATNGSTQASSNEGSSASVVVSPGEMRVAEGGSSTYDVKLSGAPTAEVTVNVSAYPSGHVTPDQTSLTFNTTNWGQPQTVTLTGASGISHNYWVVLTHTSSGGSYGKGYLRVVLADGN